ncbi:MAG: GldG family protein [Clostridia bacterium]|nr:GldG family protein [Clostridia bacterium]
MNENKNKKSAFSFGTDAFKMGSNQVAFCAVAILIAVFLNLIVGGLPATMTQFDISGLGLFTLSDQTKQIAEKLDEEISIHLIAETGAESEQLVTLLERYEAQSSNISINYVDPVLYPAFTTQYTENVVNPNSVIVEGSRRSKVVDYYEIFVPDEEYYMYTGEIMIKEFNGEGAVTSAISYVTSDVLPTIYTLEGHGEMSLPAGIGDTVAKDNYTVTPLNLMTNDAVPDDCSVLMIASPRSDITEKELTAVQTYLDKGGSALLYIDYTGTEMPNLESLMSLCGIDFHSGIVCESDSSYYYGSGYNHWLLPELSPSHEITAAMVQNKSFAMAVQAAGLTESDSHRSTLNVTPILMQTDVSYLKTDPAGSTTLLKEAGDIDGPMNIGMAVTEAVNGGESKFVVYSTSTLISDEADSMVSGGNTDLLMSTLGWMTGHEDSMTIHSKPVDAEKLVIPAGDGNFWGMVMIFGVPIFVLGAGIITVLDRRKK